MPPRTLLAFLTLSIAWGSGYLGTNIAVREIGPFAMVFWRLCLGVAVLCIAALVVRPVWPRRWQAYAGVAGYTVIGMAFPLWLLSWSLQHADSSLAAVLISTAPIFTMLIAHVALGDDRMTRGRAAGVLVGFAGVVLLMAHELAGGVDASALAALAMLLVALCYAVATVFARRFTADTPPVVNALVAQAFGALILSVLTPLSDGGFGVPVSGRAWAGLLWVGIMSSGIAFVCFYHLIHAIGPTRMQTVNYLTIVVAMVLGVLVNGEPLVWNRIAGSLLIVSALFVANRKRPAPAAATGPTTQPAPGD